MAKRRKNRGRRQCSYCGGQMGMAAFQTECGWLDPHCYLTVKNNGH